MTTKNCASIQHDAPTEGFHCTPLPSVLRRYVILSDLKGEAIPNTMMMDSQRAPGALVKLPRTKKQRTIAHNGRSKLIATNAVAEPISQSMMVGTLSMSLDAFSVPNRPIFS